MKTLQLSAALGVVVLAAPAFAQEQGGGGYQQRDQTRAEVQQRAEMMFKLIDLNHDGVVTKAEAEQAATQFEARSGGQGQGGGRMQRMIDQAFGNSQSITLEQLQGRMLARFDAMDLNHDGVVTAAEREQFRAQRRAGAQGGQMPAPAQPGSGMDRGATTPPRPGQ